MTTSVTTPPPLSNVAAAEAMADMQAVAYQLFCVISLAGTAGASPAPPPTPPPVVKCGGIPGSPASAYRQDPSLHEQVSPSRELLQHSLQLRMGSPKTSYVQDPAELWAN